VEQNLRGSLFPTLRQLAQFGGQRIERRLDLAGKSLAEDVPVLGLG